MVGIHRYIRDDQLVLCDMHLVRDGMIYALACPNGDEDDAPPHLDFLEVVSEFSYHLIDVDRKGLVAFLQSQLTEGTVERIEKHPAWKWLMAFKKTLVDPEHGGLCIEEYHVMIVALFSQRQQRQAKRDPRQTQRQAQSSISC